jgi:hypothetical protein
MGEYGTGILFISYSYFTLLSHFLDRACSFGV